MNKNLLKTTFKIHCFYISVLVTIALEHHFVQKLQFLFLSFFLDSHFLSTVLGLRTSFAAGSCILM